MVDVAFIKKTNVENKTISIELFVTLDICLTPIFNIINVII